MFKKNKETAKLLASSRVNLVLFVSFDPESGDMFSLLFKDMETLLREFEGKGEFTVLDV